MSQSPYREGAVIHVLSTARITAFDTPHKLLDDPPPVRRVTFEHVRAIWGTALQR